MCDIIGPFPFSKVLHDLYFALYYHMMARVDVPSHYQIVDGVFASVILVFILAPGSISFVWGYILCNFRTNATAIFTPSTLLTLCTNAIRSLHHHSSGNIWDLNVLRYHKVMLIPIYASGYQSSSFIFYFLWYLYQCIVKTTF